MVNGDREPRGSPVGLPTSAGNDSGAPHISNTLMAKGGEPGGKDSPVSLAASNCNSIEELETEDDGASWDNGSWDEEASVATNCTDDEEQDQCNDAARDVEAEEGITSPSPNCQRPRPQLSLPPDSGVIKVAELQCNCLELIMPLPADGAYDQPSPTSVIPRTGCPDDLPDGTATKTLPNGRVVLVNYERLLQNEATKRILLQRSVATHTNTIAELRSRLKEVEEKDRTAKDKLTSARAEIAQLKEVVSRSKERHRQILQYSRQWLNQRAKSKEVCISFKFLLMLSILWLAVMNVSVHSRAVRQSVDQQQLEGMQRKLSFLRGTPLPVPKQDEDGDEPQHLSILKVSSDSVESRSTKNDATAGDGNTNDLQVGANQTIELSADGRLNNTSLRI